MSSASPMQHARNDSSNSNGDHTGQQAKLNPQSSSGEVPADFVDQRPQTTTLHQLQKNADNSGQNTRLKAFQRKAQTATRALQLKSVDTMMNALAVQKMTQEEPLQAKVEGEPAQREAAGKVSQTNHTGLPDQLKSGIESLSGVSIDHVKVHYNSQQPAQLNAHAYAQGNEIHVAPGQERHLPHEAWHVVQQAQGRVSPTKQLKTGAPINYDLGLEAEADVMGQKALDVASQPVSPDMRKTTAPSTDVAQLARLYDETLSPQKSELMRWVVEENRTLGLNTTGESGNAVANKKGNFSWHHILAFAELAQHGEGKTAPANHGGNVRLGPMKNRFESSDISGGTAIDYSYLPLDESGNIALDSYSKGAFDETITPDDASSLATDLAPETHNTTPQATMFAQNKKADAFAEWFLEAQIKTDLLTKQAIGEKVAGAEAGAINTFVSAINKQFDSLLRTYKYYNKKREVQTTSGVPMTDISEGNFGHIVITKGVIPQEIKASTVIDALLSDQKWIKRGSQGAIQDNSTTYKFGIAKSPAFISLIEAAAAQIDLTAYKGLKLDEFEENLGEELKQYRNGGTEGDEFDQGKENEMIGSMVENMKNGAVSYDRLWDGIDEDAVKDQYVRVKVSDDPKNWPLPVPEVDSRETVLTTQKTMDNASKSWEALFVAGLTEWGGETPLYEEGLEASQGMYIDFKSAATSIANNEQKWAVRDINNERRNVRGEQLPPNFLRDKTNINNVKSAIAFEIDSDLEKYLSSSKESIPLDDVKEALRGSIGAHFNVCSKRSKGVKKDLVERKQAFGADFAGFVQITIWNVINSTKMPTNIEGTEGKKWDELGDTQTTLYEAWLERENVAAKINSASTSIKLAATLP